MLAELDVREFYLEYASEYMAIVASGWPEHVPVIAVLQPHKFKSYHCCRPFAVAVDTLQLASHLIRAGDNAECVFKFVPDEESSQLSLLTTFCLVRSFL